MQLTTLPQIVEGFDALLIDQFGVLLNGSEAYDGVQDALARLAGTGKRIILLSNSGKRAEANAARLTRLGFERSSFEMVLSSGEVAFADISARIGKDIPEGAKVWVHARDDDRSAIDGLPLTEVDRADDAELLIVAGSQADAYDEDWYRRAMKGAAARKVPALCTNPDMTMLTPHGPRFGAGRIATLYQQMGGPVDWIGKPYPMIYRAAQQRLGGIAPDRVLCIGDSPAHDIRGGQSAGFRTALTRTGLHADLDLDALRQHCRDVRAEPDYILPRFDF